MKKGMILLVVAVAAVVVVLVSVNRSKAGRAEVRIGAILPLTGDLASYGQNARDGMMLLADQINAKGGVEGRKLTVIFEDSRTLPDQAVSAINKLISVDNVVAIIGDVASSATLAMAPVANRNKIVVVSPAASSPDVTLAGPYIYRVWPSDTFEADRMAEYVKKEGIRDIAILFLNNDYGHAMTKEFRKALGADANIILREETFDQNATDIRTQLTRVRESNAKSLYLISYPKDTAIILRQFKELAIKASILSTSPLEDPLVIKEVGNVVEGAIFTSPIPPDASDPIVAGFKQTYEQKFGKQPGVVADYAYDALSTVVEAMKQAKDTSRIGVATGMERIKDLHGATGIINFDVNGDVVKPAGIKTVSHGTYTWKQK